MVAKVERRRTSILPSLWHFVEHFVDANKVAEWTGRDEDPKVEIRWRWRRSKPELPRNITAKLEMERRSKWNWMGDRKERKK
ncbi:hypothetical protein NL676_020356 [Syzygium grande]|nr:hypothetical protein NL676_020356 [Syzygium grande]